MMAHRVPIRRLILTGGFAGAIAVAPALAVSTSGADFFVAQPACPPGDTYAVSTNQCVPELSPGPGAPSQTDLSQPGAGYSGSEAPDFEGAPSQRELIDC